MHFSKVYGVTNFSIKVTKNDETSFTSYRYMAEKETVVPDSFIYYIKEKLLDTRNFFFFFGIAYSIYTLTDKEKTMSFLRVDLLSISHNLPGQLL